MPRWLNFALGLIGLLVIAFGALRIIMRHLPDAWWSGRVAYEGMIVLTVLGLVAITVRALLPRQRRSPSPS